MAERSDISQLIDDAIEHISQGELEAAKDLYEEYCVSCSTNADAWANLGSLKGELGDPKGGEVCLKKSIRLEPNNAQTWSRLAALQGQQKQYDAAIDSSKHALSIDASSIHGHLFLANALNHKGKVSDAISSYETALKLQPSLATARFRLANLYILEGRNTDAEHACRQLEYEQQATLDSQMLLGIAIQSQNRTDEALSIYQNILQTEPNHAEAHARCGEIYNLKQQYSAAESCFRNAVLTNPKYAVAHANLGFALHKQDKTKDSLQHFETAIHLAPDSAAILYFYGLALRDLTQLDKAEILQRKAIAINPRYAEAHNALGVILTDKERYTEAITYYNHSIKLQPNKAETHFNLALALGKLNQLDDATAHHNLAIELKPDLSEAYLEIALIAKKQGDVEKAIATYRRALRINPEDAEVNYMLSALGAVPAPHISPASVVASMFDKYAERFDEHLVEKLEYKTPNQLNETVRNLISPSNAQLNVLDLGCGTGLCGMLFRDIASNLVGVDLAQKMLDKARERDVYDDLVCIDINMALKQSPEAYDLVLAADVFVYIGELLQTFKHCQDALRPGGLFGFSLEAIEDHESWKLRDTGRYAHSLSYIRKLAAKLSLDEVSVDNVILRKEGSMPVEGHIVVLRKPGTA